MTDIFAYPGEPNPNNIRASDPTLPRVCSYVLSTEVGLYGLIGIDSNPLADRLLSADPGSYLITDAGVNTNLLIARLLNADPGSYSITGIAASLDVALLKGVTGFFLLADPGSYGVTGANAGLFRGRVLNAESGIYVVSGANAGRIIARMLAADPGAYVVTGQATIILAQRLFNADPGSYLIIGSAAKLIIDRMLSADPGTYWVVGSVARAAIMFHEQILLEEMDMRIVGGLSPEEHDKVMSIPNIQLTSYIRNKKYLEKVGSTWYLVIRDDDDMSDILRKPLKDKNGNDIEDIKIGILAQEGASLV